MVALQHSLTGYGFDESLGCHMTLNFCSVSILLFLQFGRVGGRPLLVNLRAPCITGELPLPNATVYFRLANFLYSDSSHKLYSSFSSALSAASRAFTNMSSSCMANVSPPTPMRLKRKMSLLPCREILLFLFS